MTIKVEGYIDNNKVLVLIDNGATHNFIDEGFVKEKGFKTKEFQGFEVVIGNEKPTLIHKMVEKIKVNLGDYVVTSDPTTP